MGVKFWTSWRNFREFSKTPSWRGFSKNIPKSVIFGKKSKEISLEKMKKIFLVRFSRKIEGEI